MKVPLPGVLAAIAICGCATGQSKPRTTEEDVRSEIRALREENSKLERRIERLEASDAVAQSQAKPTRMTDAPAEPRRAEPVKNVPALTVVKLKPKAEPAPKIPTGIEIVEPGPEILDRLSPGNSESEQERDPAVADAQYQQAMVSLKTGNLAGAVIQLQTFAAENPKDSKADNALFYSGIGLMGMGDYQGAANAFETLIDKYPAGDAVQDGMLKLGECTLRLNRKGDAQDIYKKVVRSFPGTEAASQAEQRLAALSR